MTTRYVYYASVVNVEERFETISGKKAKDGSTSTEQRSLGWFVRITESSAIHVGKEKPELKRGDRIKVTYEKVP